MEAFRPPWCIKQYVKPLTTKGHAFTFIGPEADSEFSIIFEVLREGKRSLRWWGV
jgi:hypothetical protein